MFLATHFLMMMQGGVAPPVVDDLAPISLDEAKLWLKVDGGEEDALITGLVRAAALVLEKDYLLVVRARSIELPFAAFGESLRLRPTPLNSVTGVAYTDATGVERVLTAGQWRQRQVHSFPTLLPAYATDWPATEPLGDAVRVTINAGYATNADVPDAVKVAVKMLIAHWYELRLPVSAAAMAEVPLTVETLLNFWRARAVAA